MTTRAFELALLPEATAQNQILVSGAGPGFDWGLGVQSAGAVSSVAGRTGAIVLTHTDITDWNATLAPYALTANIPAPYTLPTASTSTLGGVKVDGTSIHISSGVISSSGGGIADAPSDGNLYGRENAAWVVVPTSGGGGGGGTGVITAGSTPTSGFEAGQILMSDGADVKAMTYGVTMNWGSAAAPIMVSSEAGTPGLLTFTGQQSAYSTAFGVALHLPGAFPAAGGFGVSVSAMGYLGLNNLSNWMNGLPDFAMVSDANEGGRGDFRSINNPAQPLNLRVYNIYTNANDGEWGCIDWITTPNTLTVGARASGSGVVRNLNLVGATVSVNGSPIGGGGGGGIADAPSDGTAYIRQDGAWSNIFDAGTF